MEYEQILIEAQTRGGDDAEHHEKPSITGIISYAEGGYFGDCDIFAQLAGYQAYEDGRDMAAVSAMGSSVFVLPRKELEKIKQGFYTIYKDMKKTGLRRFQYHQLLIARQLREYLQRARCEEASDAASSIEDNYDENMSLDSDTLHE